jgi:serine/threonine protein kinase
MASDMGKVEKDGKERLDQYQLMRVLGSGAYGTVKMAVHRQTKQKVAIKFYPRFKLND